jgi:hypothetical protein
MRAWLGVAVWAVILFLATPFIFTGLFFLNIHLRRKERQCERG